MDRLRGEFAENGYDGVDNAGIRESGNGTDESINGPVIFSCAKCRTILGDTFAYVASIPERNLFALHAVPDSVACSKARKMSTARGEEDSVYYELICTECDSVVGRRYVTTVEDMDVIRNAYSLDIEKVLTYELGKCMSNRPTSTEGPPPEFYTSVAFHDDLVMVKNNVTAIAAKLQRLEQTMARLPATSPRSAQQSSRKRVSQGLNPEIYHIDSTKRFGR
ncbi:hypothetical protein IWW56_001669 [Coemansia sp. RSA 2131]|nr:hypothetical protein LPJ76_003741 [Coemansia sp. RSA 638]KAJ2124415.1 hypothetical protein IW147_001781 [Coemansia sp. RSA 720]KAJ2481550.1 hypothetical protein IWW56_001669 [Coemansia sp. RSA 2131]KAJ2540718.1 hypothetical protein GGF49_004242 [Coemansia sp. RSA 1853]